MKLGTVASVTGILAAAGGAVVSSYLFVIRPWHLKWGATDAEVRETLPGDDLVPDPKLNATHAVTIHAPATAVWPWIVQMGQGRGGLYSYDWLENLLGLNIHSADRIVPEFQNLKVGDTIPLAPNGFGPPVAIIEPGHTLVLHGIMDVRTGRGIEPGEPVPDNYFSVAWIFVLKEVGETATRLIERFRLDYNQTLLNTLAYRVFLEPGSFIMERKMLLGIKERAERYAH